jgi:hypothetical protein
MPGGEGRYRLAYRVSETGVEISAMASGAGIFPAPARFILPVVARKDERVERAASGTVRIMKRGGPLTVRTDAAQGFDAVPAERTFNLVPGFTCVPLAVTMQPGREIHIYLEA